jgi:hypothetical protein
MTLTEGLIIAATALSPLIAVQVTKWLDARKEAHDRRLYVFRTLMATRAQRLSTAHVQALNLIDVNFDGSLPGDRDVTTAWKVYLDHLNTGDPSSAVWLDRYNEHFGSLLLKMGLGLGFDFDPVHIKRAAYSPHAHGELENDQHAIRKAVIDVLQGKAAVRVQTVNDAGGIFGTDELKL